VRATVFISVVTSVGVWIAAVLFFYGILPFPSEAWNSLAFPRTTSEAGDSLVVVEGLFSSLAVVLALVAVLLQGRDLKASALAQKDQAVALEVQSSQQVDAIKMQAHSVRLQFLLSEVERLGETADRAHKEIQDCRDPGEISNKWDLVKNSRSKQKRYREECERAKIAMEEFLKVKGVRFPSRNPGDQGVEGATLVQPATASDDTSGSGSSR